MDITTGLLFENAEITEQSDLKEYSMPTVQSC